jgi:hypothetical protein
MPCDCRNAQVNNVLGHLWVRCRAEGCRSIWYRPSHRPGDQGLAEFALIMLAPPSADAVARRAVLR